MVRYYVLFLKKNIVVVVSVELWKKDIRTSQSSRFNTYLLGYVLRLKSVGFFH